MKILRRGIPKAKLFYQGECHSCNTVVEFSKRESEIIQGDVEYVSVACPVCQKDNIKVESSKGYEKGLS